VKNLASFGAAVAIAAAPQPAQAVSDGINVSGHNRPPVSAKEKPHQPKRAHRTVATELSGDQPHHERQTPTTPPPAVADRPGRTFDPDFLATPRIASEHQLHAGRTEFRERATSVARSAIGDNMDDTSADEHPFEDKDAENLKPTKRHRGLTIFSTDQLADVHDISFDNAELKEFYDKLRTVDHELAPDLAAQNVILKEDKDGELVFVIGHDSKDLKPHTLKMMEQTQKEIEHQRTPNYEYIGDLPVLSESQMQADGWSEVISLPSRKFGDTHNVWHRRKGDEYRGKKHKKTQLPKSGFNAHHNTRADLASELGILRTQGIHLIQNATSNKFAFHVEAGIKTAKLDEGTTEKMSDLWKFTQEAQRSRKPHPNHVKLKHWNLGQRSDVWIPESTANVQKATRKRHTKWTREAFETKPYKSSNTQKTWAWYLRKNLSPFWRDELAEAGINRPHELGHADLNKVLARIATANIDEVRQFWEEQKINEEWWMSNQALIDADFNGLQKILDPELFDELSNRWHALKRDMLQESDFSIPALSEAPMEARA
jgi:hypothetical protein